MNRSFKVTMSLGLLAAGLTFTPAMAQEMANPFGEAPATESEDSPFVSPSSETSPAENVSPFDAPPSTSTAPFGGIAAPEPPVGDPFADPMQGSVQFTPPANAAPSPFDSPASNDPFSSSAQPAPAPQAATSGAINPFADPFAQPTGTQPAAIAEPAMTSEPAPAPAVTMEAAAPTVSREFAQEEAITIPLPLHASIQLAVDAAKKSDRHVAVIFSGDSHNARNFERLLSEPVVLDQMDDFEVVRVDYRANRDLAREFSVREFPYIVIINKWGYTEGHLKGTNRGDVLASQLQPYKQRRF